MKDKATPAVAVIDLFCGAGGLAFGLKEAGLHIATGVDLDPFCRYPLESNTGAKFECRDITGITGDEINKWFGSAKVRVLAGCAPCQPFSTYSQSRKSVDDRWTLLGEFSRLVAQTLPEIVTMENVPGLASQSVWADFISTLESEGYHTAWQQINCTNYAIPQTRKRLVLLASLLGPIKLLPPETLAPVTVEDAIGGLPPIEAGQSHVGDPLHTSSALSPLNLQRIRVSKPGGTWRDWPAALRAKCHTRKTGATYPSVYGRMEWGRPAPTMTTQCYGFGNGRFGHPDQDRAISLREAALIQSFPIGYKFVEHSKLINFSRLGTLIGNAVPPMLGKAIGLSIKSHLTERNFVPN